MKKRDLIYLLIAVTIFLAAGYLAYTQLLPKDTAGQANKSIQVEKVGEIPSTLDGPGLTLLRDSSKTQDFNSQPDLKNGLGNNAPFGQ